jgi:hypothetical protein
MSPFPASFKSKRMRQLIRNVAEPGFKIITSDGKINFYKLYF